MKVSLGGDYSAQPAHKPRVVPRDFLLAFYNTGGADKSKIAKFCNDYNFVPFWFLGSEDLVKGFERLWNKYQRVIKKLLDLHDLSQREVELINQGLDPVRLSISIYQSREAELARVLKNRLFTLESDNRVKPEVKITFQGHPEVDSKKGSVHISVRADRNGEGWRLLTVENGLFKVEELYPSKQWETVRSYLDQLMISKLDIEEDDGSAVALQIDLKYTADSAIAIDDLYAARTVQSSNDGMLCEEIWSYIQNKKFIKKHEQCKVCGDLYVGRSPDYCTKEGCRKEWRARTQAKRDNKLKQIKK